MLQFLAAGATVASNLLKIKNQGATDTTRALDLASTALGAANTVTNAAQAGKVAKTPNAGPTPLEEFKPDTTGMSKADAASLTKASQEQAAWLKQQKGLPQADPLKVNPGGYTKPKLQEAYLEGLKQSGAKLNKTGEIVKQSGQAYKKPGWDRKAQLMAMDPMRRQRMLAIDKATVSAAKNKKGPVTNNTGKGVMKTERAESPLEKELREEGGDKSWSLWNITDKTLLEDIDRWGFPQ